jgi:hypothetical protein
MAREVPWLSRDEFWSAIEECRQGSADTGSFAERLPAHLAGWEFTRSEERVFVRTLSRFGGPVSVGWMLPPCTPDQ